MNRNTKILIGVALGAGAGYGIYLLFKRYNPSLVTPPISMVDVNPIKIRCNPPNIACPNNPKVCFNPMITYLVNPCKLTA